MLQVNLCTKTETDSQNLKTNLQLPKGKGRGGGGINYESRINIHTLLYIKQSAREGSRGAPKERSASFWLQQTSSIIMVTNLFTLKHGEDNGTPLFSSTLAWKIPWTEEPGRLQAMGSRRVGQDWATSLSLYTFMHWRRKWQPTPVFLPWGSQGWGAWWAAVYGVTQSWTRLKRLSSSSSTLKQTVPSNWCHPNIVSRQLFDLLLCNMNA